MDSKMHQQIREQIAKVSQIGIIVGKNPSLDHMAAALGLYLGLTRMGKQVSIASPTNPLVEISNLVGIDKVKKTLSSNTGDLIVSFPYREGEIEKVSYNLTDGLLNIVVKAGEQGLNFNEKDIAFKRSSKGFQLLFFVGVAALSDVDTIITQEQVKETVAINIDNKSENTKYGTIVVISEQASSLSEQIADLLTLIDAAVLDIDIAQNLLSGISSATDDFQSANTTAIAFEMAGILMKKGAVRPKKEEHRPQPQAAYNGFVPQRQPRYQPQPFVKPPVHSRPQFNPSTPSSSYVPQQNSVASQQPVAPVSHLEPVVQQAPVSVEPQPVAPQTLPKEQPQQEQKSDVKETPVDWLTPKVYKGSTIV